MRRLIWLYLIGLGLLQPQAGFAKGPGFEIDTELLHTEQQKKQAEFAFEGELLDLFRQQKRYVKQLLAEIGLAEQALSAPQQQQLKQPATTKIEAFVAFSAGLELRDQGQYPQARKAFKLARMIDPAFEQARDYEQAMPRYNLTAAASFRRALEKSRADITRQICSKQTESQSSQQCQLLQDRQSTAGYNAGRISALTFYNKPARDPINQSFDALELMRDVQNWPQQSGNLFTQAVAAQLPARTALIAAMTGFDTIDEGSLKPLLFSALDQGLSAGEISAIAEQLQDSGLCY